MHTKPNRYALFVPFISLRCFENTNLIKTWKSLIIRQPLVLSGTGVFVFLGHYQQWPMLIDFWLRQENNYPFFAQNEKSFVSKIWGRESFNRIRQALLWQKLANTFNTFRNTLPASCCRCWCFYLKIQRKPNPGSQDYFPKLIFIMKCWFVPGGANYFEFICTGCIQAELFARLPHSILCITSLLAGFAVQNIEMTYCRYVSLFSCNNFRFQICRKPNQTNDVTRCK